ncbi:MAG: hypothetical protein L6R39_000358 [Caloplaca ligustica]|nr:MAG: hypothetical protein L6R39_000358 [Caloplaca ligustica]
MGQYRALAVEHRASSATSERFVGWVDESPGRGTLGLIVTCLFTIFLCTWVVIHPRVCKRSILRVSHKIALFLKTLVAPEFIAVEGLQEWSQARRMVKDCSNTTGDGLKLIHAFYVGMLALRYRTSRGDKVIWPNQFTWLLQQRLLDWRDHERWGLSIENIRDKSNADGTAKLLALVQVSWFAAQSIMRRAHDLPLSQLESMTLSYIPLFAITYLFWWVKPKDVLTPSVVDLPDMSEEQHAMFDSMAVSNIFDDEGLGKQGSLWSIWYLTPRVFEKEADDNALQEAQQKLSEADEKGPVQRIERAVNLGTKVSSGPAKETVLAHWDPELYRSKLLWPITCVFGASFGALHLISWDSRFPSPVESWLWRGAALASIVSMLIFMQFEKVVLRWDGPLTVISLASPFIYLLSRIVMIGGVIAAFRASDPAIYNTYVVSTYWIHIT